MRSGEQSSRTRAFLTSLFCRQEAAAGVTLARAARPSPMGSGPGPLGSRRSVIHYSTGRGFGGAERTCREFRKQKPERITLLRDKLCTPSWTLRVQSRHLLERVESESLRVGCPAF
jgi:hypothetical protein